MNSRYTLQIGDVFHGLYNLESETTNTQVIRRKIKGDLIV
jgi:hypothetical protein